MNPILLSLLVALGGAGGALSRYWIGQGVVRALGAPAPWATLTVNVLGCGLAGAFFAWASVRHDTTSVHALAMVGFLGGLTTFSAFSLDALALWLRGQERVAVIYVLANVLLSLASAVLAFVVTRKLW
ncbi:MAG: fluoride efflux transporter CrcB [Lysobacterales bacterium]